MAKKMPTKPVGAETKLWHLTYSRIAEWAGLSPRSVQQYASRGEFDRNSLESVLSWVNARRARRGLPLIGLPAEDSDGSEGTARPDIPKSSTSGYDPLTAEFKE